MNKSIYTHTEKEAGKCLQTKKIKSMTFAQLGEAEFKARRSLKRIGRKNFSEEDVKILENEIRLCSEERMRRWNALFTNNAKLKAAGVFND